MVLPRVLNLSKRQKFVIATLVMIVGIILIRLGLGVFLQWRIRLVGFSVLALILTVWSIHDEDFSGIEWVTLPILPTAFALSSALVFPLIPERLDSFLWFSVSLDTGLILGLLVQLIFLAMVVVGYYASLLTANIFNVAAVRSIQLLRVAHSIGFLVAVATALFFFVVISSLHLSSFVNFFLVFVVSGALSLPAIWSVNLEQGISSNVRNFTLMTALVLSEVSWILSFWPVGVSVFALFLTALFYELVGIIQYHLGERLNARVANEFVVVAVVVFVLTIFTAQWGA